MANDYYATLGVPKTATHEEIKKAFRKKAHEFHPDKQGGDAEKFKEVNEAYQVLGNEQKRKTYDQFGSASQNSGQPGGFSYEDFARNASSQQGFGGFNVEGDLGDIFGDFFGFGGRTRSRRNTRGADIQTRISIAFEEMVQGAEKEIRLRKNATCKHCHGNSAEPGTPIKECPTCGGTGVVQRIQNTILGAMRTQGACSQCHGEGKIITQKCQKCRGAGVVMDDDVFTVKIPAGIENGQSIRLSGKGEAGRKGAPAGDLYIEVEVLPSRDFTRNGNDILSTVKVSFAQAALGDTVVVNTVDGEGELKIPSGIQSGTVLKIRGKGVPRINSGSRGDHLVTVHVQTPTKLSRKAKKIFKELEGEL